MLKYFSPSAKRERRARELREELAAIDQLRQHCNEREPRIIAALQKLGERDLCDLPARAARGGW